RDGSISGSDSGELTVLPEPISFDQVSIGEETLEQVRIRNTGAGTLRITRMDIVAGDSGSIAAFSKGADWVNGATLEPSDEVTVTILYKPESTARYSGFLRIDNNDPTQGGSTLIEIETPNLAPEIYVQNRIDFPRVAAGTSDWQVYPVQNIGQAPLVIEDIRLTGSEAFSISFPDPDVEVSPIEEDSNSWTQTLQAGEGFPLRIQFAPADADPQTAEIIFESNDPNNEIYRVELSGNAGSPCIEVTDEEGIAFGLSSIGNTSNRTITITNCSRTAELRVDSIELTETDGDLFRLRPESMPGGLPEDPLVIPARETANFVISYTPIQEEDNAGMLQIRSTDPAKRQLNIPVTGRGSYTVCPVAVAMGRIQGTTQYRDEISAQPLQHIQLTGTDSSDPDGTEVTYEWSVVSRPQGSQSQLAPNNTVAEPQLWLDIAGTYVVELVVYDGFGLSSCEPAVVTIHVVPGDEIHIQLVWDAEGAGQARDGHGTDLDLHYLHPLGRWDLAPYDVFWRNREQNWGTQANPSIARLDIDDLYGVRPENINHDNPESGLNYAVGVYYYRDSGFGAADATVRIYVHGQLAQEFRNSLPATGHFWYVGVIQWPTGNIIPRNEVRLNFP
ncbi:MAG: choice-of-anchor D domain-containing protein, partial [Bradymonadaceae bacterium]